MRRRRRGERGAALVELALVVSPLIFIALGAFEIGLAWREKLMFDQASRSAARVGASLTDDPVADREALRALVSNLDADRLGQIEYVVIYQSSGSGTMPSGCSSGSMPGCNHYPLSALQQVYDDTKWECGTGALDDSWCPTSRDSELHSPVDLGVYIAADHDWFSGLMPWDISINANTIMRLDPITR
ncbi:MAG: TadE family protein [Actinomycetota bacterium]